MASYYIYAVNQADDVIQKVKICTSYTTSDGPYEVEEKTRATVVRDIDINRKDIYTIYKNSSGDWKLGKLVITERIDNEKYIKTQANGKKVDNLDNIIQY